MIHSIRLCRTDGNPFVAHRLTPAACTTDIVLRTAINEENLSLGQLDLRDALSRFCAMHPTTMEALRRGGLWRMASIDPVEPYAEVAHRMDALADDLVGLLGKPWAQEALRGRRPDSPDTTFGEAPEAEEPRPFGMGP